MKPIIRTPLALVLLIVLLSSCTKDWLAPKPYDFFTPENVYVDRAGFESILITMRKNLKTENTGARYHMVTEFAASDLAVPDIQLDFYKVTPNTDQYYTFLSLYTTAYASIKDANVLISRIDDIEWTNEQDRNFLLAEAYWHRAYWYYRLVNSYGDVPFISEELTEAKLDFSSHSRWAILSKIQSDMEYAVQWLPVSAVPGAISKGAGDHLLAKIYLANLEYDKAISSASAVINGPYALMTQRFGVDADKSFRNLLWDLHRPENFNIAQNKETILAIVDRYDAPAEAKSVGLYTMRMYHSGWFNIKDSRGGAGMVASGPMYDTLGRGNAQVRPNPFYQYDLWKDQSRNQTWQNTQDLRRSNANWIDWKLNEVKYNNPNSVDFGKPINVDYFASKLDTFYYIYAMPYYKTFVPQDAPGKPTVYGGNGDWYLFRLAETYLIRAEAQFWKGNLNEAANDINQVRQRSNASLISAADVTIDYIFDERARELFAETPRHSELVRASYIMAKSNLNGYSLSNFSEKNYYYDRVMAKNIFYQQNFEFLGNKPSMAPFHVLWPVPASVILANTLGTVNQNVGYDGAENNVPPLETIE